MTRPTAYQKRQARPDSADASKLMIALSATNGTPSGLLRPSITPWRSWACPPPWWWRSKAAYTANKAPWQDCWGDVSGALWLSHALGALSRAGLGQTRALTPARGAAQTRLAQAAAALGARGWEPLWRHVPDKSPATRAAGSGPGSGMTRCAARMGSSCGGSAGGGAASTSACCRALMGAGFWWGWAMGAWSCRWTLPCGGLILWTGGAVPGETDGGAGEAR